MGFEGSSDNDPDFMSPDDRLWRHPSEVSRHPFPVRRPRPARGDGGEHRGSRPGPGRARVGWGALSGAAAAGAIVSVVVLAAMGAWSPRSTGLSARNASTDGRASPGSSPSAPGRGHADSGGPSSTTAGNAGSVRDGRPTTASPDGSTSPQIHAATGPVPAAVARSLVVVESVTLQGTTEVPGIALDAHGTFLAPSSIASSSSNLSVVTPSGAVIAATLAGTDAGTGISVVRAILPSSESVPAAPLDTSHLPTDGEAVALVGIDAADPAAIARDAGSGDVSGVGVSTATPDGQTVLDATQVAAGASLPSGVGTVVLDPSGSVVGIVTHPCSTSGSWYAMPMALAYGAAQQIATAGHVSHGWLGVEVGTSATVPGVTVESVLGSSPAQSAGIQAGDEIVSVGETSVVSPLDLEAAVYLRAPGVPEVVTVERSGSKVALMAVLGTAPD